MGSVRRGVRRTDIRTVRIHESKSRKTEYDQYMSKSQVKEERIVAFDNGRPGSPAQHPSARVLPEASTSEDSQHM